MKTLLPQFLTANNSALSNFYIDFPYVNLFYDKLFSYVLFSIIFGLILTILLKIRFNFISIIKENLWLKPRFLTGGFTLIELLTVVAIIAILSVIAITIFSSTQKSARNGARRAEVKAIANALEVNKTGAGYQPLAISAFASGVVPAVDGQSVPYCINTTAGAANPATWTSAGCPAAPWTAVTVGVPIAAPQFKICTTLENPAIVFCIANAQ